VQLPFLLHLLGAFRLLPILTGEAPPEAVAAVLEASWGGPETLIVVSSDLSHFLDYAACQAIDARTAAAIEQLDEAAIGDDGACGRVALRGLLLAARRRGLAVERLDLRNSGDTAGPRDRVVGYGAWALAPTGAAAGEHDKDAAAIVAHGPMLLDLARIGIEIGFETGRPARIRADAALPDLLRAPGAAFITLRRNGWLRGCIGSPVARRPLAVDVVENAFNAAFKDHRFPPLQLAELAALELSVSVLTRPMPMQFVDERNLLAQLRPRIDGLIIGDAGSSALFLPSVWEELQDPRQFLAALKQKAGLPAHHFSPTFTAHRFRAVEIKRRMTDPLAQDGLSDAFIRAPLSA
jgi:AmmeMemoRadiSam system protein A